MKWRCPLQATLTTLTVQDIYTWVQRFCQQHPLPKRCGRPQKYPETLLLTLLLFSVHEHVSYRRLLFALTPERFPNQPLSALGALVYRFHPLCAQRVHQLLSCFLWWLWMRGLWAFFFRTPPEGGYTA